MGSRAKKKKSSRLTTIAQDTPTTKSGDAESAGDARESDLKTSRITSYRRVEWILFLTLFFSYAYFHQGGGWNQNARFDQVRAIVEGRQLSINEFIAYRDKASTKDNPKLGRVPLPNNATVPTALRFGNTGDVTQNGSKFYPNKPPGTTFTAVFAYSIIHCFNRLLGNEILSWSTLTFSYYLSVVFSIGLCGALAGIAYFRILRRLFLRIPLARCLYATFAFGLGTMMFPYSTMFLDHVIVANMVLWSFLFILKVRNSDSTVRMTKPTDKIFLYLAGLFVGFGTICNYLTGMLAILFTLYIIWVLRPRHLVFFFWLGGLIPAVVLAWYHHQCFGGILTTANANQASAFMNQDLVMGVFGKPKLEIALKLLFSEYRGLLVTSPILIMAAWGWVVACKDTRVRAEGLLCGSIFLFYLLINSSFQGEGWAPWSGGWGFCPRYLIPGMIFLAIGLGPAFHRLPKLTGVLGLVSMTIMLLGTAVDAQPPLSILKPFRSYILPLAAGEKFAVTGNSIEGPVSVNPVGVYEAWFFQVFPKGSKEARWNSFNLGELIFPESLLSLVPLIVFVTFGIWFAKKAAAG